MAGDDLTTAGMTAGVVPHGGRPLLFWTWGGPATAARIAARVRHAGYGAGDPTGTPGLWFLSLTPPPGASVAEAERFGAAVLAECRPAV